MPVAPIAQQINEDLPEPTNSWHRLDPSHHLSHGWSAVIL